MNVFFDIAILIFGLVMLVKGADIFVGGASGIAVRFGIPPLVIGLTIVAMGTSAPEAAVSISASLKDSADIAVGNVIGSNIMNILVILGTSAAIRALAIARSTMMFEIPFTIAITILMIVLGYDGVLGFADGVAMIACFAVFLCYLFRMARKSCTEDLPTENASLPRALVMTILGLALVVGGGNVTVDAATSLALAVGMSERFVGLTIVAFGTSLPELATSVAASRRGSSDIAIGNIIGSNIFNILFVLGLSTLITPVPFNAAFFDDAIISVATVALVWLFCARDKTLSRREGAFLLICYAAYFIYILD